MVYTSIEYFPPYICANGKRRLTGRGAPETPVPMGFSAILGPCESGISPNPPGSLSLPDLWALALRAPCHSYPTKSPSFPPICDPSSCLCHHLPWFKTTTTTLILYLLCFIPFPAILCRQRKHRHRRNVTSHHFKSFLLTSFHFYVYYNFFCSYQLKSKYNTHTHIQQLNISLHSSSLLTLTSIINWKSKTIQIY